MRRGGAAVVLALMIGAAVSACGVLRDIFDPHHGQHCVSAHDEWTVEPVYTGKRTIFIPAQETVCDHWVPDATPTPAP